MCFFSLLTVAVICIYFFFFSFITNITNSNDNTRFIFVFSHVNVVKNEKKCIQVHYAHLYSHRYICSKFTSMLSIDISSPKKITTKNIYKEWREQLFDRFKTKTHFFVCLVFNESFNGLDIIIIIYFLFVFFRLLFSLLCKQKLFFFTLQLFFYFAG